MGKAQQEKLINKDSECKIMIAPQNPSYYTDLQLAADQLCANLCANQSSLQNRVVSVESTALSLDFGNSLLSSNVCLSCLGVSVELQDGFRWSTL